MKLDKSTKILINLTLVLCIALLVKTLITIPNFAYASDNAEYSYVWSKVVDFKELDETLKIYSTRGWKLHSHSWAENQILVFFEKEIK